MNSKYKPIGISEEVVKKADERMKKFIAKRHKDEAELSERELKILEAMRAWPDNNHKSAYLSLVCEMSKSEILRGLDRLMETGRVIRTGRHTFTRYVLTEEGRD